MAKIAYVVLRRSKIEQASCSIEVPDGTTPEQAYKLAQEKFGIKDKKIGYVNWRVDSIQPLEPENIETDIIFAEGEENEE